MNRPKIITKYFIKSAIDEMFASSKMKPVFIVVLMIFVLSMIYMPVTVMIGKGYESFHSMGQEGILLAMLLSLGAAIVTLILILVEASPILLILGIISSIRSIVLITLFGMYIDFRSPKLNWENERAMFKKNYMPLLIMLIVFLLGTILVIAAIIIKNYIIIFSISMAIVIIGSWILYRGLVKHAYKVYNEN